MMDSSTTSLPPWIPNPGDEAWLALPNEGQVRVTVIEAEAGAGALVRRFNETQEEHTPLSALSPVTPEAVVDGDHPERGAEAAAIFQNLITAATPTPTPAAANDPLTVSNMLDQQTKEIATLHQSLNTLITKTAPILLFRAEFAPPQPTILDDVPQLCHDINAQNDLIREATAFVEYIIAGVQL